VHIPALRWCLVWQVEEEDRLKRFWELEIRRVCEELRFSYYITVRATGCGSAWWRLRNAVALVSGDGDDVLEAVLFVQNSHGHQATRHHVRVASGTSRTLTHTCYACPVHRTCAIFLAIKAEASPFGEVEQLVRQLTDLLELEDKDLLQHEMLLLMGNRFHVTVYHPYRALRVRCLPRDWFVACSRCAIATVPCAQVQAVRVEDRYVLLRATTIVDCSSPNVACTSWRDTRRHTGIQHV